VPMLKLELDQQSYESLIAVALREWRPTVWEAEFLLRQAIYQAQHHGQAALCPTCARPYPEPAETSASAPRREEELVLIT
jgi:hypothetical protein